MNDYSRAWADQESADVERRAVRAEADLLDLADRWEALAGMVAAGGSHGDGAGRGGVPGPRVPIRADVVDLQVEVERWVGRYVRLAAGAMRTGTSNTCSTVGGLHYLSSNIRSIWEGDPMTGQDVADGAGRLRWQCRRIAGETHRAFPVDVECPDCGCMSLWAHPGRGLVRCGIDDCGGEWTVDGFAVTAWQSTTPASVTGIGSRQ